MKSVKEEDRHRSRCERYNGGMEGARMAITSEGEGEETKVEEITHLRFSKHLQFDLFKSTKTTFQSWKEERKSGMMEVRERKKKKRRRLDLGRAL